MRGSCLLLAFACTFSLACASSGDDNPSFQLCLQRCQSTDCLEYATPVVNVDYEPCSPLCSPRPTTHVPVSLWLLGWECRADCAYVCMWALEKRKAAANAAAGGSVRTEKYGGKWPFIRVLGMQEPAAVTFSLLNLAANLHCLAVLWHKALNGGLLHAHSRRQAGPLLLSWLWLLHLVVSVNAWLWSSIFHCRDTYVTERLDYYSAGSAVAFNMVVTLARTLNLQSLSSLAYVAAPIGALYAIHVWRMQHILFDYGLHVAACVAAGVLQSAAWTAWALASRVGRHHPGRFALLSFMLLINACSLLEVLDFAPLWGVMDAHALWHAASAPLTYLWFVFVFRDVRCLCAQYFRGKVVALD